MMIRPTVVTSMCAAALSLVSWIAMSPTAQADEASQRAMIAQWAGNYDTDAFLREPAIHTELQKLVGSELEHLMHNLNVRGSVDLNGQTLSVNGNAPHQGTEEEAIVCVLPGRPAVEAAIFSKGVVTVFTHAQSYEYTSLCIRDWITLANSQHADRFVKPANVSLARSQ